MAFSRGVSFSNASKVHSCVDICVCCITFECIFPQHVCVFALKLEKYLGSGEGFVQLAISGQHCTCAQVCDYVCTYLAMYLASEC